MNIPIYWKKSNNCNNDVRRTLLINDIALVKLATILKSKSFSCKSNFHAICVREFCFLAFYLFMVCVFSFKYPINFRNFVIRYVSSNVTTSDEKDQVADLEKNIIKRKAQLHDIDQTLPQKNGTYLNVRMLLHK